MKETAESILLDITMRLDGTSTFRVSCVKFDSEKELNCLEGDGGASRPNVVGAGFVLLGALSVDGCAKVVALEGVSADLETLGKLPPLALLVKALPAVLPTGRSTVNKQHDSVMARENCSNVVC